MSKCMYDHCTSDATHVLVDYKHDVIGEGEVYCKLHAFEDGREECPCCYNYQIDFEDEDGEAIELLPTYPADALDGDGCCSDHP